MQIILLDEFFELRKRRLTGFIEEFNVSVISDRNFDFTKMKDLDRYDILAFGSSFFDWKLPTTFLDSFRSLKYLCISGGWHEHIDFTYCRKRKIVVTYIPGFSSIAASEWCLMATLMLARRLPVVYHLDNPSFDAIQGTELRGKKAGIIGLGGVGRVLIRSLSCLGMESAYWSRTSRDPHFNFTELDDLMSVSDFLYFTFYDGERMKGFMNKATLDKAKNSSFVISGLGSQPELQSENVDWQYIISLVKQKRLSGLAVECGENEVISVPNENILISTGHSGWFTEESFERQTNIWVECIKGVLRGQPTNILQEEISTDGH